MLKHLRLSYVALFIGFFAFAPNIVTAKEIANQNTGAGLPSSVAEMAFFSSKRAKTLADFIESAPLTKAHKSEIMAYLRGHQSENKSMPAIKWKYGTAVLELGTANEKTKVDFSDFVTSKTLIVNGAVVRLNGKMSFDVLVKTIKGQNPSRSAWNDFAGLFFKPADASIGSFVAAAEHVAVAGTYYLVGFDQFFSCFGAEAENKSECSKKFRDNATMILTDLGPGVDISQFNCKDGQFKALAFSDRSSQTFKMTSSEDTTSKTQVLKTYSNDYLDCEYDLQDGRLASFDSLDGSCIGRTRGELSSDNHPLKEGQRPKIISQIPVPIDRLERCCADNVCQSAMAKTVAKDATMAPSSNPERGTR